jgi:CRISPR/Cas system-associated exonuclease Cas4 (RecB family)
MGISLDGSRDHLSVSAVNTFKKCPMLYYFVYRLGQRKPPSGAMYKGTKFHDYAAHNYEQKVESEEDIPLDEATDYFVEQFREEAETVDWQNDKQEDAEASGLNMVETYHKVAAPLIMPKQVEVKIPIVFADEAVEFWCIIDLITKAFRGCGENDVIDHKTKKAKPNPEAIRTDGQLTAYATAFKAEYPDQELGQVRLDSIVTTKRDGTQVYRHASTRTDEQINDFLIDFRETLHQIQRSIKYDSWPKAPDFAWWCSPTACGFWESCKGKNCPALIDLGTLVLPQETDDDG